MKQNKKWLGTLLLSSALLLGACGSEEANESTSTTDTGQTTTEETTSESTDTSQTSSEEASSDSGDHGDHEGMVHDESGEIPEGLEQADNPTYPVGSQVTIETDHMPGMEGATGTIEGAFDTIAYEVTYPDTETGETVANHKWVVHEEMVDPQEEPYQPGDEVELAAYHMPGMQGATATIDSAEDTTVYMVTYTDTETGDTVENHKWVTEGELAPAE